MMSTFLTPTGTNGQWFDMDAVGVVPHCIHEGGVSGINSNNGQRALASAQAPRFNPDSLTMSARQATGF
jgi:hypothetical protein